MKKYDISVVGLGFIGIPILLKISSNNKITKLYGIDIDQSKIKSLNQNKFIFFDEMQANLYNKNREKIKFDSVLYPSDIYFITISNSKKLNDTFYLQNILNLLKKIILISNDNSIIILETTLNPGFSKKILNFLKSFKKISFFDKSKEKNMCFCYMAEKIIPGNTITELGTIPRLISISNHEFKNDVDLLIKSLFNVEVIFDEFEITEYVKIIENTYRNYSIGFSNYLSIFFDQKKINYSKIFKYANLHPRINILNPSIGVGGHCIPLDPLYLLKKMPIKSNNPVLKAYNANLDKEKWVMKKIQSIKNQTRKKIIILGLTYKENIDDYRESVSINIINNFKNKINKFYGYDPFLKISPSSVNNKNFQYIGSTIKLRNLCKNNQSKYIFVIFVKHNQFIKIIKEYKKIKYFDFCGLFDYENTIT